MNFIKKFSQWVVTILVPVILILGAVRFLLTPIFVQLEYRMPNFPEDRYGFTQQDRLHWSKFALEYLLNGAGIEYLDDLRFEDGSPLYNERELQHMLDVQVVVEAAMKVLYLAAGVVFAVGVWARRGDWWWQYRQSIARGGWLTVAILAALIVGILLSFDALFVAFHKIFFEGDTWIFLYSDTLIRLFPVRFWQDAFITVGGLALLGGAALGYFAGRTRPGLE
ncbi:MAG: TIGR01906 family membrane protein [Chloroflexi bacterium]|jgi:integral membrane protein (TIGR01906 family)|nr:TIGR01906 family membrane protein [Chloroflexota bacterium]